MNSASNLIKLGRDLLDIPDPWEAHGDAEKQGAWAFMGASLLFGAGEARVLQKAGTAGLETLAQKAVNGCCCFPAGTPVQTEAGSSPIETIQVGQLVYARDEKTGDVQLKPVTQLMITQGKPLFALVTQNKLGQMARMEVTDNHPYWVMGQGWVESAKLKPGMVLESLDQGELKVLTLNALGRVETTYNFTVEDYNTYFAGRQKAFVHNTCTCLEAVLTSINKAVNSNMGHAVDRAVERGIFESRQAATEGFKKLSEQMSKGGFPKGTIMDTAHADRILVPIGNAGMAVYQVAKNGTAKLKTVLNAL